MSIFSYVKEIGEQDFQKFLEKFSHEYAECYMDLGSRSYQANANRVSGAVIGQMIERASVEPKKVRILDVASGPEMLRRHIADELQEHVVSLDLNAAHFAPDHERRFIGSFLNMPFEAKSFDYTNMALAWHYTSFVPSKNQYERLQVLHEMNRVLRDGGRGIINMIYSLDVREEQQFREAVGLLGFEVVEDFSGKAQEGTQYASRVITLQKMHDLNKPLEEIVEELRSKDLFNAFKFKQTEKTLKDSRRIVTGVELNGRRIDVKLNAADRVVHADEKSVAVEGQKLKVESGGIEKIPREKVIEHKFVRINIGKRYILFKKLESGPGAVIIK